MKNRAKFVYKRLVFCDSGFKLNTMMHVFILITLVFALGFLVQGSSVSTSILFGLIAESSMFGEYHWGAVALMSVVMHVTGLLLRGLAGLQMMRVAFFSGFYIWLWAAFEFLAAGFVFQFFSIAVPNLLFWSWYAWQWRKRAHAPGDPNVLAFVN